MLGQNRLMQSSVQNPIALADSICDALPRGVAGHFMPQKLGQLVAERFQRSRFATNGNGAKDPRNQKRAMLCFAKDSARDS
jgi:hypothetical protein